KLVWQSAATLGMLAGSRGSRPVRVPIPIQIQGPALVLSGGGVRGAYEVGVVSGIVEALGPAKRSPFRIFAGTSVGAINAAFLAANSDRHDLGIDDLRKHWDLRLDEFLHLEPLRLFETPRRISEGLSRFFGQV